jgi:DNA-binding NtrC family response regulator
VRILIADDEPVQLELLEGFLTRQGYEVVTAADGAAALATFRRTPVQLVLLDHRMPGLMGDALLAEMKALNPLVRAIMITAYGAVDMAVNVMKLGADDFMEKPVDLAALLGKIQHLESQIAVDEDAEDVAEALEEAPSPLELVGDSGAMSEVLSLVRRVAETPWPVLVRGETGTGKDLVARMIHLLSPRREGRFVQVNCAAVPETLFESELFGHERGAFTGATARRRGRFELAQGGTLLLDEVGELPPALQPKLLKAVQDNRITRVGGEQEIEIDVRIVTATNRDLKGMVKENLFREDLYYRLNTLEIEIPPLRQRRQDIPALVDHFLRRYATRPVRFSADAMDLLVKYPYPGNVRELEHTVQRAATLTRGVLVRPADLPPEIREPPDTDQGALAERLDRVERDMLLAALEKTEWVQTRSAELLGISERVLRYKMAKHGLRRPGPGR